jgi:hypothetical protein
VPPGDYLLKIVGCELKTKKDDETSKYLNWRTQIVKPEKYSSAGSIWHITSLKDEALFNLRNLLEDLGVNVPKSIVQVPIATIVEKQMVFGATLDDDTYNNKTKSKIQATFKKSEYEDTGSSDDDEEEEDTATETAEVEDDEDLEELDVDDL